MVTNLVFLDLLAFSQLKRAMDILKKFSEDQEKSAALEDAFKSCRYPDALTRSLLAADIGATEEDVQVWERLLFSVRASPEEKNTSALMIKA